MAVTLDNSITIAKLLPASDLTYEQFLDWLDGETLAEWVDGKVMPMASTNAQHQDIAGFLGALLRLQAEEQGAGMVLTSPFQMRLARLRRGRQPDLMFVAKSSLTRLKPDYLDGAADWIIEIASARASCATGAKSTPNTRPAVSRNTGSLSRTPSVQTSSCWAMTDISSE